jgi:hypothetical protein
MIWNLRQWLLNNGMLLEKIEYIDGFDLVLDNIPIFQVRGAKIDRTER